MQPMTRIETMERLREAGFPVVIGGATAGAGAISVFASDAGAASNSGWGDTNAEASFICEKKWPVSDFGGGLFAASLDVEAGRLGL
jgi:hypothetical protein